MRLTIVHDRRGNIVSLIACPADAPPADPAMRPGEFVTQVDFPEITVDLDERTIFERLSDLARNYRVELDTKATLTKKDLEPKPKSE
jgi:hypothetical protein